MSKVSAVPVTVLAGFLGSGKTTLLQGLLRADEGRRTAVLINEFGEISIDHLMVKSVRGNTLVLQNGCVCCTVRSELRSGLRELLDSRDKGEIPPFDRIVIETTGLADPVPLVQTLTIDPMIRNHLRLSNLVSTVDGRNGVEQLRTQEEAVRQAATADRLVITKTDLCNALQVEKLERNLSKLNPLASISRAPGNGNLWELLVSQDSFDCKSGNRKARSLLEVAEKLWNEPPSDIDDRAHSRHRHSIASFAMRISRAVDWTPFSVWLSLLVHRHGRNILRIKGFLGVPGTKGPVSLNVVQHFIHAPVHLDEWPDDDHSSRLVFIVQELNERAIRASLESFFLRASQDVQLEGSC